MEILKFVLSFISSFISTLSFIWLIVVYPYSNISLKSAWIGTAVGTIAAIVLVLVVAALSASAWKN